ASTPACPGTDQPPCAIVYAKADPDDPTSNVLYAYDIGAGAGQPLPGHGARSFFTSPDRHRFLWDDRELDGMHFWNLCTGAKDVCPFVGGNQLAWSPGGDRFLTITPDRFMAQASFAGDVCTGTGGLTQAYSAQYAPSGNQVLWIGPATTPDD